MRRIGHTHCSSLPGSLSVWARLMPLAAAAIMTATSVYADTSDASGSPTDNFLTISYSEKTQIRSSMKWMHGLPKLMMVDGYPQQDSEDQDVPPGISRIASKDYEAGETGTAQLPYAVIGKLFYVKPDNTVATCNGALTGANDVILTAAHCVLGASGEWNRYFLFIQGYATTNAKVYAISCASVPAPWGTLVGKESFPFDYAFLKLRRPSADGSLGISSGIPPEQVQLVGYSDNVAKGQMLLELEATIDKTDGNLLRASANPLRSGSSGMPWIASSIVHSVSSFWLPGEDLSMWGPRFTQDTFELLRHVQSGCG